MKIKILRPFAVNGFQGSADDIIDVPYGLAEALIEDKCAELFRAPSADDEDDDDLDLDENDLDENPRTSVNGIDDLFNKQLEASDVGPAPAIVPVAEPVLEVASPVVESTTEAAAEEAQASKKGKSK